MVNLIRYGFSMMQDTYTEAASKETSWQTPSHSRRIVSYTILPLFDVRPYMRDGCLTKYTGYLGSEDTCRKESPPEG